MSILRGIFYLSLAVLAFWALASLALSVCPIELTGNTKDRFLGWRMLSVAFAILLTLAGTLPGSSSSSVRAGKILVTFIIFIGWLGFITIATFDMCAYSEGQVLFQNRKDPSDKIVWRDFGCGATDSSPATICMSRIKYYTHDILHVRNMNIDTSKIDHTEWQRIYCDK